MKIFLRLLLVWVFVFSCVKISNAETVRKKVVKIKPTQIEESATPSKTTRVKPKPIRESPTPTKVSAPPKAQPIATKEEEGGPGAKKRMTGPTGVFAAVKGGFTMPRLGGGLEIGTTLLSTIMNKTDLAGRLGVGYLKGFDYTAWSASGDIFVSSDACRSKDLPLTLNLGVGINFPFGIKQNNIDRNGNIGFNVFLGLNYDVFEKGQLFVEGGFNTFVVKDIETRSGCSLLLGYKHFF